MHILGTVIVVEVFRVETAIDPTKANNSGEAILAAFTNGGGIAISSKTIIANVIASCPTPGEVAEDGLTAV